jgi:hypothetical protein
MISRNTLLILVSVLILLNIATSVYIYANLQTAKDKIRHLEANSEQSLSLIYPQGIDTDISTRLMEIEKRLKRTEQLLNSLYR